MKKCGHCNGIGLIQAESHELDKIDRVVSTVKKVCKACHGEGFFNVEE